MKTMIVRLFEPAPGTGRVAMHGLVEDVRTGASAPFQDGEQLVAAIKRALDTERGDGPGPPPATPAA